MNFTLICRKPTYVKPICVAEISKTRFCYALTCKVHFYGKLECREQILLYLTLMVCQLIVLIFRTQISHFQALKGLLSPYRILKGRILTSPIFLKLIL